MDVKKAIRICKNFIEENKNRPILLHKAIDTVLTEIDELKKSVDQIYDDYQDAGRMMFEFSDVIDEMAKYIAGLDIDEDICSKTGKTDCDKMAHGECETCIREYFRKKVNNNEFKL